jgi:glycine cleavage system H protein
MNPEQLYYTKDHEWLRVEEGDEVVIGITDHAQEALGDITFIDLPRPGKQVKAHESLAVVESVKAASEVYSPVAGTVDEVNAALSNEPEKINQDPFGEGWICRLVGCDRAEVETLMTAAQYEAYLARH